MFPGIFKREPHATGLEIGISGRIPQGYGGLI